MGKGTPSNRSQVWFLASPYSGSATAVKIMQRGSYPTLKITVPGYGLRRSNTKAQTFPANIQNSVRLQNSCSCRTFRETVKNPLSIMIFWRINDVTRLEWWNFIQLIWGQVESLEVKASVGQFANLTMSLRVICWSIWHSGIAYDEWIPGL